MTAEDTSSAVGAPPYLRFVADFINTVDVEAGEDELTTPEELAAWIRQRAEAGDLHEDALVGKGDLERALRMREALRALAMANHEGEDNAAALAELNGFAGTLPLAVRFGQGAEASLQPAVSGVDGALAMLVAGVYRGMLEGTWRRLKICASDTCRWAFYDRSKNRSGTWCSMAVCGNRTKVRKYQQRRKASAQ